MKRTRRQFLRYAAAAGSGTLMPLLPGGPAGANTADSRFRIPLRIPPLLGGDVNSGERTFDLSLGYGGSRFFADRVTPTIGINGAYLGPVLRMRRGDQVRINVTNRLSESSTLHWHGMILPARMDGGPHQVIQPGQTWTSSFPVLQGASTQWYHSHMLHRTGLQVYFGLAGLLYVDDPDSDSLAIPSEYGVDDIPLILQDRSFNPDGSLRYLGSMHDRMAGMTGEYMLVNGTPYAHFDVRKSPTRLRILNGSNARIYRLEFDDRREFVQIATDGGMLAAPVAMRDLVLSPGERAEILVEFKPGERLLMRHRPLPRRAGSGGMMMGMMAGIDHPFDIMGFTARPTLVTTGMPRRLITPRHWAIENAVRTRRFSLDMRMGMGMMRGGGFGINGRSMDTRRIDLRVPLGDIEAWEIVNDSPLAHPFHIHDTQFRIVTRNGMAPAANEQGLKDTVLVHPGERVGIVHQFEHHADAAAPYMFHCHILEHEDAGMMGQFVVVA